MANVEGTSSPDIIDQFYVDLQGDGVTVFADNVDGAEGDDFIWGYGGNDVINGSYDDDYLTGGADADFISGGAGTDTANYTGSSAGVFVNLGTGQTSGGDATGDTLVFIENLSGSLHGDTLVGDGLGNLIQGWTGGDLLIGGGGADRLFGGDDIDRAYYGGSPTGVTVSLLTGTGSGGDAAGDILNSIENLDGSPFADTLTGDAGSNRLAGGEGDDILDGGGGADAMDGFRGDDTYVVDNEADAADDTFGDGIDTVRSTISFSLADPIHARGDVENLTLLDGASINATGNALANILIGNSAANTLIGGSANDKLSGGSGNDRLDGGTGVDAMRGSLGNDIYLVDRAADRVIEAAGQGNDRVFSSATFKLGGSVETLILTGTVKINGTGNGLANAITGNARANALNGGAGNDIIKGGAGNDAVIGSAGKDILFGQAGVDALVGGLGRDVLRGGTGADRFDFNVINESVRGANHDVIVDFSRAQHDRIDVSTIDANRKMAGNQKFSFIGTEAFGDFSDLDHDGNSTEGAAGQLRVAGRLVQGDVNGDRIADFEIKVNLSTMLQGDFIL